jgi:plastocyanin
VTARAMGDRVRRVAALVGVIVGAAAIAPWTAEAQRPEPTPEPNFAVTVLPRPCAYEGGDEYERKMYELEGWQAPAYERYPGACQRLRFAYGPIHVKPGQNDVLIEPVTIEKPMQDGYVTRFKPNLVLPDGTVPPVEQVHLHHGTWISQPDYGSGPFFAAGEEKTIAPFPKGYGMPVKASDVWELLYMVHSAVQQPMEAYIVYDVDFVPKAQGDALGIKPAYPVWLDVRRSAYPVFNVQRDFGGADRVCTWPREECAAHDPYGQKFEGQGEPGNGVGTDLKLPDAGKPLGRIDSFNGGTLIGIGGHVHPGGLQNEIDLVRPGGEAVTKRVPVRKCRKARRSARKRAKSRRKRCRKSYRTVTEQRDTVRIYTGVANYWDHQDHSRGGGPPTSWDFSMRVAGLPYWGVQVKPGDILRSNVTYDTSVQSTYEDMGIAVTLFVPNKPDGTPQAPGVNPFQAKADTSDGCKSGGLKAPRPTLCDKGLPTHGHYPENGNYGGAQGEWNAKAGSPTTDVGVVNFQYQPGDLSMVSMTGVPTVKLGTNLRFTNLEGGLIYHTATSCAFPCLGRTGAAFPISDGRTSTGHPIDFDSSEMGVGVPAIGPAKQALDYQLPVTPERGFQPGDVVTYFCRIHPGMRGAFEVTDR